MQHYVAEAADRVLITEDQIQKRIAQMGAEITRDYQGKELVIAGILRGCVMFFADLVRHIHVPAALDFMSVSSYGKGTQSSGSARIHFDLQEDIKDKHLLIVEDIIDSGVTLSALREMLAARGAQSIEMCCLLNKPSRRKVDVDVKYIGFDIPDEFVVGYGLDYASKYRNYKEVVVLKREIYEK